MFIRVARGFVKGSRPSILWLFVIAVAFLSVPAQAFDAIDVFGFISDLKSRAMGYRGETVDVGTVNGAQCKLHVVRHVSPEPGPLTVMLHGFGDSRMAWRPYIALLKEQKRPYKNFVVVEWPRHGKSDCDQVQTLQDAAKTVDMALKKIQSTDPSHPFQGAVAASLGVGLDAYLAALEPAFKHLWIAPPLLAPAPLQKIVDLVRKIHSNDTLQVFLSRTSSNPDRRFPEWILSDILKRALKSQSFVNHLEVEDVRQKVLAIDPQKMQIFLGQQDRLVTVPELDPLMLKHFAGHIHYIPCTHNIVDHCSKDLVDLKEPLPQP